MAITINLFYPAELKHEDPVGLSHLERKARDSLHWS